MRKQERLGANDCQYSKVRRRGLEGVEYVCVECKCAEGVTQLSGVLLVRDSTWSQRNLSSSWCTSRNTSAPVCDLIGQATPGQPDLERASVTELTDGMQEMKWKLNGACRLRKQPDCHAMLKCRRRSQEIFSSKRWKENDDVASGSGGNSNVHNDIQSVSIPTPSNARFINLADSWVVWGISLDSAAPTTTEFSSHLRLERE